MTTASASTFVRNLTDRGIRPQPECISRHIICHRREADHDYSTNPFRFPYPVTTTFVQLLITSLFVTGASRLSQLAVRYWEWLDFADSTDSEEKECLCPAAPDSNHFRKNSITQHVSPTGASPSRRGWREAREVLPLAIVFVTKVLLENMFIAYVPSKRCQTHWTDRKAQEDTTPNVHYIAHQHHSRIAPTNPDR